MSSFILINMTLRAKQVNKCTLYSTTRNRWVDQKTFCGEAIVKYELSSSPIKTINIWVDQDSIKERKIRLQC